jgi:hypothetical protein
MSNKIGKAKKKKTHAALARERAHQAELDRLGDALRKIKALSMDIEDTCIDGREAGDEKLALIARINRYIAGVCRRTLAGQPYDDVLREESPE